MTNEEFIKSFIRVEKDGKQVVIIPFTQTKCVVDQNGRALNLTLADILSAIGSTNGKVKQIANGTTEIHNNFVELTNYVNPLMDDLKEHIEILDGEGGVGETIFDQLYKELDAFNNRLTKTENVVTKLVSDVEPVVEAMSNHMEVISVLNENSDNTPFTDIYKEIDTLSNKITGIEEKLNILINKL